MITDPFFYVVAIIAVFINGISKGGFGSGLGTLATPLMALAVSPAQAAAIMLPILCVMDVFGLRAYWRKWSVPHLRTAFVGAIAGMLLGWLTFGWVSEAWLKVMLGCIAIVFPLLQWWTKRAGLQNVDPRATRARGVFWGGVSGFTSFIAHAGGPPLLMYLLREKIDKTVFVGTTVMFFTLVNLFKLPFYLSLGQFTSQNLLTSLVLSPLAPLGIALGVWLHKRVNEGAFFIIVRVMMVIVGIKLVYDGVAKLMA